MIGEGGNLGLTQRARIEYALGGGRVNTDAIDNSGGVDCSDHEVNIKILLDAAVADGDLTRQAAQRAAGRDDRRGRRSSVLKDDYEQAETLTLAETQAREHARRARALHPQPRAVAQARPRARGAARPRRSSPSASSEQQGLTRPELAVLLAYSKIELYAELLDSDVPEDPTCRPSSTGYFPEPLPERFGERMREHRLRREIIATQVVNNMLHGGGTTFAFRLHEETGAPASEIARAYTVAREVFRMRPQWEEIEALDNRRRRRASRSRCCSRAAGWWSAARAGCCATAARPLDIAATVEHFAPGAEALYESMPRLLGADDEPLTRRAAELEAGGRARRAGRPRGRAWDGWSRRSTSSTSPGRPGSTSRSVAAVHFQLGSELELHWLRDRILDLPREDRWRALARAALRDDLFALHRDADGRGAARRRRRARTLHARVTRVGGRQPGRRALPADPGRHPRGPRLRPDARCRSRCARCATCSPRRRSGPPASLTILFHSRLT